MTQRDPRMIGGIYQVGQVITTGPLLTVYTAYNRNTNGVVGLLVIELPPTIDAQTAQQLLEPLEQRRVVESPHVIHVYDRGIDDSRAYIATDPPRGVTLRDVLDNENVDLQRAVNISLQMARGLFALQGSGIVDIDLRPQLITVDIVEATDRVQLDDVGLRRLLKQLGYVNSQRDDDIGYLDPRYASPESLQNGPIGPWSDVYQSGLLLFELVAGRLPFVGRNPAETAILQSTGPVPRMDQFHHDTPQVLQDVVDHALAKNPAQRYPNAAAFLSALEAISIQGRPHRSEWRVGGDTGPQPGTGQMGQTPGGQRRGSSVTNEMVAVPTQAQDDITLTDTLTDDPPGMKRSPGDGVPLVPEEEGVYAYLYFEKDVEETRRFAIKEKYVVVGRTDPKRGLHPEVDITEIDPRMTVSRQHARIRFEKTFFYIEDLKSRNKTRLKELPLVPLKPELIQHGDVVHFGSVRMVFQVPGMPDSTAGKQKRE